MLPMLRARVFLTILAVAAFGAAGCHHKPPVAKPTAPPSSTPAAFPGATSRPAPPVTPVEPPPVPVDPTITAQPTDPNVPNDIPGINRSGIFKPVFFAYDSDELDDAARQAL